jgi:hypothetical protein
VPEISKHRRIRPDSDQDTFAFVSFYLGVVDPPDRPHAASRQLSGRLQPANPRQPAKSRVKRTKLWILLAHGHLDS